MWENAVIKKSYQWLKHCPTVRQTDNYRYILLDIMKGKYRNATIQSWQIAGLVLGLHSLDDEKSKAAIAQWKNSVINSNGMWKIPVSKVDFAMLSYAVLKTEDNPERIRLAMDWTVNMLEQNLCEDGMISYSQGKNSTTRFVDTLGMVCPFLALYGKTYNQPEYMDLAVNQIQKFREIGLYHETQLPCHAVNAKCKLPLGIYGWGRGTAWYMIGLLDTYLEITDIKQKELLSEWLSVAAQEYCNYQKADGSFYTILQGSGQYDSSVTAAMAYFYRKCAEIFDNEQYEDIADHCILRIMNATMRDGAVDLCQGDTHGIGIFSQVFDIMPFTQGLTLKAIKK